MKIYLTTEQKKKLNKFLGNSKVKGDDVDFFQNMRNMFNSDRSEFELDSNSASKLSSILNTTLLKGFEAEMFLGIQAVIKGEKSQKSPPQEKQKIVEEPDNLDIDDLTEDLKQTESSLQYGLHEPKKSPKDFKQFLDKLKEKRDDIEENETEPEQLQEDESFVSNDDTPIQNDKASSTQGAEEVSAPVDIEPEEKKESVSIPLNTKHADPSNDDISEGFFTNFRDERDYF